MICKVPSNPDHSMVLHLLLLLCSHKPLADVSLKEVSQLQAEAAIHLVLIVQLEGVFCNGEHLQFSMPKERLLKEMRTWRPKRVTDWHLDSEVLVNLVLRQAAVEAPAAARRWFAAPAAEPVVLSSPWAAPQPEQSGCHLRQQINATPGDTRGREPLSDSDHACTYSRPVRWAPPAAHPDRPGCAPSRVPPRDHSSASETASLWTCSAALKHLKKPALTAKASDLRTGWS